MTKSNHTILLTDEDDATRAYLTTNLTADGYRVRATEDRAKAIALLSLDQPDLIIADVNGHTLDLVDAVRSGDGLASHLDPNTPIIVLSERANEIHRIRVLERWTYQCRLDSATLANLAAQPHPADADRMLQALPSAGYRSVKRYQQASFHRHRTYPFH